MNSTRLLPITALALGLCVPALQAQQPTPTPNATTAKVDEGVVALNPFTVSSSTDRGYQATSTLSGTRINTSLRDIGTSIQAITKDFLEDTGVTNVTQLLLYTTSTEVTGGAGGNFSNASGSSAVYSSDNNLRLASPPTRIRGLADASIARNLYSSGIPFDSYNLNRVEINRGANSVLFGLGSPAGIINYNLSEAEWNSKNVVETKFDNYGTKRFVLDINRPLIKDTLAVRVIALDDKTKYKQDPSFRNDRRYFLTGTYRPFKTTSISVNYERGKIDSSLPRQDPPRDYLTHFFTTGKVTVGNNVDYRDAPTNTAYVSLDSGTIGNLLITNGSNPTNNAFIQYPETTLGGGVVNPLATNAARVNDFRYRRVAMQNGREFLLNVYGDVLGPNAYALDLVDPSVFDFFNNTIDGNASSQYGRIEAVNISVRQELWNGHAGIELGYDSQRFDNGYLDALDGIRGNALMLDITQGDFNYASPGNPASGEGLNPNFAQPNVGSRSAFADRFSKNETYRATGFLKYDFMEKSKSILAKILGQQNLTLLASSYKADSSSLSGQAQFMDYDDLRAIGFSDVNARANQAGQLGNIYYLGGSIMDRSTASGLNLRGYKGGFTYVDSVNLNYRDAANVIRTATVRVHNLQNEDDNRIATSATISRDTLDTQAAVLQSHWWDGALISTVGWRKDDVKRYTNGAFLRRVDQTVIYDRGKINYSLPSDAAKSETKTYSGVVRIDKLLGSYKPKGVSLDAHYAWSENFQGLAGARNFSGGFYSAPVGETKEMGFSLGLLNDRFVLRANRFQTKQDFLADADIDQPITTVLSQLPTLLYPRIPLAQLQAAGFVMPPQLAGAYTLSAPNAAGFATYSVNYTPRDVKSAVSKGDEYEATFNITSNWRMAINVAKVKSIESGKGANWADGVAWVTANWFRKPAVANLSTGSGGSLDPVSGWEQRAVTDYLSALERNGASNPEIREWRANLVTNYSFSRQSFLHGFGVGGGVRYQDHVFIGYGGKPNPSNPTGTYIADVTKPNFGPSETDFDFWTSYQRRILSDKVTWKLQLNIRNAFSNDELVPFQAQQVDVFSKYAAFDNYKASGYRLYRIAAPRTIELKSTFTF